MEVVPKLYDFVTENHQSKLKQKVVMNHREPKRTGNGTLSDSCITIKVKAKIACKCMCITNNRLARIYESLPMRKGVSPIESRTFSSYHIKGSVTSR